MHDSRFVPAGLISSKRSSHRSTIDVEQALFERVRDFVHKQTAHPLDEITRTTRLVGDIGLAGRDARKFFKAFAAEFDMTWESFEALNFRAHFGSEWVYFIEGGVAAFLTVPGVVVALLLRHPAWLVILCGFASFFVIIALLAAWRKERHRSSDIVVQDLIDSAISRGWRAVK
jgi:hypothetical protein